MSIARPHSEAVGTTGTLLWDAAELSAGKIINPDGLDQFRTRVADWPVLVLLAAGKGTRFGTEPKCIQPVNGTPLARHSIDAFRSFSQAPVVCLVGYRHDEVAGALGGDNIYVRSANPAGGTAFAAYEAFSVSALDEQNPILILSMGDRIVPASIFRRLHETHIAGGREADLTFLTAIYEPPRNRGKGRIQRDSQRRVIGIIEQNDIDAITDNRQRQELDDMVEGNCPLYAIRARTLRRHLQDLTNANAQGQYYLTDIIERIRREGGEIRTITTTVADVEYDLLCSDVTRPVDLALLESILSSTKASAAMQGIREAAAAIRAERSAGQVASIAAQLEELIANAARLGFKEDLPVSIGLAGGRLRIAFMHPDMGRFFGPAWQMPLGAGDADGREQIMVLVQASDDHRIHLNPTNPEFQEKIDSIPADLEFMYPGEEIKDWYSYEGFGTRMAENLLLSLGYFSDEELRRREASGLPLPPSALWVRTGMRKPFSLVGNAIASLRTVRTGSLGAKVQQALGQRVFGGLRLVISGDVPRGGFGSSSAVTVATKNGINALFDLGISPDMLVHLSCQAEYGTGVRAGSLDQATIQNGRSGSGSLVSSNPRDNFRVLARYPVPTERFAIVFPYSVDRDREAWRWSAGVYSADAAAGTQTAGEVRKMTGKAAELAAILLKMPLDQDFFKRLEDGLLGRGEMDVDDRRWVCGVLGQLPLLISQEQLRERIYANRRWYIEQLGEVEKLDVAAATAKTDLVFGSLFAGWRDPCMGRAVAGSGVLQETGVPLRAMVGYLFAEMAKAFCMVHRPQEWIQWVTRSQRGDRCFDIDPARLPDRETMMREQAWEAGLAGVQRMEKWLQRLDARPFDFNRGLDDATLSAAEPPDLKCIEGTSFFRGLALLDLVDAMLKRAFGESAVAVRVNAAGQGDYFQVHVDREQVSIDAVKEFIREAFYRRFGLTPEQEFVEPSPGGGAVGLRMQRFSELPELVRALKAQ